MARWGRRFTATAGFALLTLVAELTGRSVIIRLDGDFHVTPLGTPAARYYPFALAGIRVLAALVVAAAVWRIIRAHSVASTGDRLLRALGHARGARRLPRFRLSVSPRLWLGSFAATSSWFLIENDAARISAGRWPLLAPWLHTYALPVFALLSIALALAWGAVRDWLAEVESYTAETFARVYRIIRARPYSFHRARPADDRAPRHLFGLAFESRPPPLPS